MSGYGKAPATTLVPRPWIRSCQARRRNIPMALYVPKQRTTAECSAVVLDLVDPKGFEPSTSQMRTMGLNFFGKFPGISNGFRSAFASLLTLFARIRSVCSSRKCGAACGQPKCRGKSNELELPKRIPQPPHPFNPRAAGASL